MGNKRFLTAVLALVLLITMTTNSYGLEEGFFSDVPIGHWAYADINELRSLGVTNGIGNNEFGLDQTLTRAHFVTFLYNLMKWVPVTPEVGSFEDNLNTSAWYYNEIETALAKGVFDDFESEFRPNDAITREEIGLMIVNTLEYSVVADSKAGDVSPFPDVTENVGYMMVLKDFGLIGGYDDGTFKPQNTALRQEAAAILIRMHSKLSAETEELNVFYKFSGYSQKALIDQFSVISYGWYDLTFADDGKVVWDESSRPKDYLVALDLAKEAGKGTRLNVFASNEDKNTDGIGMVDLLLSDEVNRQTLIEGVIAQVEADEFDGIVIDFEFLKGATSRRLFVGFLEELSLAMNGLHLTVMVQPSTYLDGYDFRAIGEIADQVIMMAHDFNTKSLTEEEQIAGYTLTPVAPIKEVYEAIEAITNPLTGVAEADRSKLSLQISFSSAQWAIDGNGHVVNNNGRPYAPTYDKIYNRLIQEGTNIHYNGIVENPYAEYYSESDEVEYVIWYEDARSIKKKIELAKLFDVRQLSVWRLGNIPDYEAVGDQEVYMDLMEVIK